MALGTVEAIKASGTDIIDATADAKAAVTDESMAATVEQLLKMIGSLGVENARYEKEDNLRFINQKNISSLLI